MDTSPAPESFRDLLLRHRGRTGLTQRELAHQTGANRRTVQDWEAGVNYPSADLLKALIRVVLEAGGLTAGRESAEARQLWAAVLREASRMHTPFDELWLAELLARRVAPPDPNLATEPIATMPAVPLAGGWGTRAHAPLRSRGCTAAGLGGTLPTCSVSSTASKSWP